MAEAKHTLTTPDQDDLARQLSCCNGYLRRIGDPPITNAIVDEIADVLELPRRAVLCFARYGRLTGHADTGRRAYSTAQPASSARFFRAAIAKAEDRS